MLQRRVRQHDADLGEVADDVVGQIDAAFAVGAREQDDRADASCEKLVLLSIDGAEGLRVANGAHHDGERLAAAPLASAKLAHRVIILRAAGQMEAPEPLDGNDAPVYQQLGAPLDDRIAFLARRPARRRTRRAAPVLAPRDVGPAGKAGVRLGVEPAVGGVGIFGGAFRAHGEGVHRGRRPVIGQRADDGEARAAVGAVDEGVVIASVGGVEEFPQTVVARCDVRRYERGPCAVRVGCEDGEARIARLGLIGAFHVAHGDRVDARSGGGVPAEALEEGFDIRGAADGIDVHPVRRVEHPSRDAVRAGLAIDERAHAHALHDARDVDGYMAAVLGGAAHAFRSRLAPVAAHVSSP